jgi:hypothetical protein
MWLRPARFVGGNVSGNRGEPNTAPVGNGSGKSGVVTSERHIVGRYAVKDYRKFTTKVVLEN